MLPRLQQEGYSDVLLLARDRRSLPPADSLPPHWRILEGKLEEPASWAAHLEGVETIVHLAAATGKVPRRTQQAVTLEGTRHLLERALASGVRRFLLVSSNAVAYRNRPHYHYAEAKLAAEALVAAAPLDWLIVRPTLVLGPESPLQASLGRLAGLPVPLLFGTGRQAVQPIHVDDLARILVEALAVPRWGGRVLPLGGPEVLSLEDLMSRLRRAARRRPARFLRLPLPPVRGLLSLLEPVLLPVLPFTAGQLAFFANPSVAVPDPEFAGVTPPRLDVAAMLGDRTGP